MTKEELNDELHYRSGVFKTAARAFEYLINKRGSHLKVIRTEQFLENIDKKNHKIYLICSIW